VGLKVFNEAPEGGGFNFGALLGVHRVDWWARWPSNKEMSRSNWVIMAKVYRTRERLPVNEVRN
jgi:hypothetical protein